MIFETFGERGHERQPDPHPIPGLALVMVGERLCAHWRLLLSASGTQRQR
jgi:hypothetical protein